MNLLARFLRCCFFWGKPPASGNVVDAQIILTQAASDMADGTSSTTNQLLAEAAKKYSEELGIPIFAQGEVARILDAMQVPVVGRTPCEAIPDNFGSKDYHGTFGVALIQKRYCDEHGLTKALVLAAWPHTWRAKWTYQRLGMEAIIPPDSPPMIFQKGMNQKRWDAAYKAYPYEFSARLAYLLQGVI